MVKVDGDGDVGKADSGFNELFQINGIGVLPGAFGNLKHDGGFFLLAGLDDGLEQLDIIDVESTQRVFPLEGFGE